MARLPLVLLTAVALVSLSLPATAQELPSEAPPVEMPDATIGGTIEPLGAPGNVDMTVAVGCERQEIPETSTVVHLAAAGAPGFAHVVISPSRLSWVTDPGQCPGQGTVHEARGFQVLVSFEKAAPGFEPVTVQIQATIEKTTPVTEQNRTYGPYTANVTATPGYFNLYNLRAGERIQTVRPEDPAVFNGTVDNFSNTETRFTFRATQVPPAATLSFQPESLVVPVNASATYQAVLALDEAPGGLVNEMITVVYSVDSASTHESGALGNTSQQSVMAQFRRGPTDEGAIPGPGALVTLALGVAVAAASRVRARG